jgi:N-acetylneuraminic acid mutarotase
MFTPEETIGAMRREMRPLLEMAMEGVLANARGVLETAEQQRVQGLAEVAEERAKALDDLAKECVTALAEVDARRAELHREIEAMQMHQAKQEGRVELNIGGYRFQTSVQTLRRLPHTFFDAYFSGRYAQDVCNDGSIFVDRDGEHFGHVLEYMRDGVVSVAEPGAHPSVSLMRSLKREFGFYCIDVVAEHTVESMEPDVVYILGGYGSDGDILSSMERYDETSGQWSERTAMASPRSCYGACVVVGEVYVTGGQDGRGLLSSVEKYSPSTGTWSTVLPLPRARYFHAAVAVGSAMYVLGGILWGSSASAGVLKLDNTQGTWIEMAPMPVPKFSFTACAVGSIIYVFGGAGGNDESAFKFDTEANEWSTLAPMPYASLGMAASALNGLVYIVGLGVSGREVVCFDPVSEVWSMLASTSISREDGVSFVVGGHLYAAGGTGSFSSVERYDVASNTWTATADMLDGHHSCCAVTMRSASPAEEVDLFDSLIAKAARRHP